MKLIFLLFTITSTFALGEGTINGGPDSRILDILSYQGRPNFKVHIPKIETPKGEVNVIELCKDGEYFRNVNYDDVLPLYFDSTADLNVKIDKLGYKKVCTEEQNGPRHEGPRCQAHEFRPRYNSEIYKLYVKRKKSLLRGIFSKKRALIKTKFVIPKCR